MFRCSRLWGPWVPMVVGIALCVGCAEQEPEARLHPREISSELRPTDADDPGGYGGAPVAMLESSGGHVRVWYALSGPHQPPQADLDDSGVPDYVERVAEIADEVGELLADEGWRRPLVGSLMSTTEEPLDLFLLDFSAGDGNFRPEKCGFNGESTVCSGHLRVENDFTPLHYPSREYALRVVISHEFFHAVQYAYSADVPAWWSEGSATWFQEHYWDEQNDFERLTGYYFEESERSLNDRQRGPFDGFAYGAGLFVYFLEQQVDAAGIRRIHELLAEGYGMEEAIDDVLIGEGMNLSEAFALFSVWNVFTGDRAVEGEGYPGAERFGEIEMRQINADQATNWNVEVDALAAAYAMVSADRDVSVRLSDVENRELAYGFGISLKEFSEAGVIRVLSTEEVVFKADELPVVLVLVNGEISGRQAAQVQLRAAIFSDEGDTIREPEQSGGGGGGCSTLGAPTIPEGWLIIAAVMMAIRARRRARQYR